MLDRYFNRTWDDDCGPNCQCQAAVNITESDEAYHIDVAAPGLDKGDFSITIDEGALTIKASEETKVEESKGRTTRKEFSYSNFTRVFTLPEQVDQDKISSTYDNGILRIILPKTEESKPKPVREVKVN
jgi:HSP20 family protein